MIPDIVCIWVSFFLAQRPSSALFCWPAGVILLGAMRILASKQNRVGTSVISQYDYTVNVIGQRTAVATRGTAFPATPSWLWGYDAIGQLTRADSSVDGVDGVSPRMVTFS